jgi:hypothetical protein
MTFDAAERIADAVLYEGYVLYPYRGSAAKNQFRWQFGVVAPQSPRGDGEPWFTQTECLIDPGDSRPRLSIRLRFLRPRAATEPADASRPWLEGVPHAIDVEPIALDALAEGGRAVPIDEAGIDARATVRAEPADRFIQLQIRVENLEPWRHEFERDRDLMLRHSMAGAHLLCAIDGGAFVSMLEPPPEAAALVQACENRHTWPVLVGDRAVPLMLSAPIILYDFPAVAPESQGDLCDATEIDEILSLRILTMTEEEKREARATDPRARQILDRVEALTPDALAQLHGTVRSAEYFNPPDEANPDQASVLVDGHRVARGSRVRLHPTRRADAMDMFLRDQAATVAGVYRDVDDRVHIAVTVDADPGASLHDSFGRFFYFDPAEIQLIDNT